jgi:hypothetical protein
VFSDVCCKRLFKMFHLFKHMLQQVFYLDVAYVSHTCCKCFIWMLHMFHIDVTSVLSKCCICFTHMLQQYVLNISSVSYVASKCFMLQVFYGGTVNDGHTAQVPGDGAR